jgi:4-hydroxy-2-oxoheptanedioate aldolase
MRTTMHNAMKEKIARGGKVFGTFYQMGSETGVECLGIAGLDYIIIDTEHGPFETERVADFVRAAELHGLTPLVRIKEISRPAVLKNLDVGAMGLVVPFVKTMEDIRRIIEYGKYAPLGERGCAMGRGVDFGKAPYNDSLGRYFDTCNAATSLIPQCETKECLDIIEEVMATDGIDGVFVGPNDLAISMGMPGQFTHPDFEAAVQRILKAAKDNGKFAMIYVSDKQTAHRRYAQGFDAVAWRIDVSVYIGAFMELVKEFEND